MVSGVRSCFSRARRSKSIPGLLGTDAFHWRGLDEKIWDVFAPSSAAWRADFSRDPAMEVWMPMRTILHNRGMRSRWLMVMLLAVTAFGATVRLYLKDGTYQLVREFQVLSDRVKYLSAERGEWEEIPLEL